MSQRKLNATPVDTFRGLSVRPIIVEKKADLGETIELVVPHHPNDVSPLKVIA